MVEPASKQLQQILLGQHLCSARDLRRCRGRVKRLSGDLPAFDSIWLDALVQAQKLTAFQSQAIETAQLDQLRIGPSVVLDRIGGCVSETFLARDVSSSSLIVVKRAVVPVELKQDTLTRLNELVEKSRGILHSGVVVPHACSEIGPSKTGRPKARAHDGQNWPGARVDLALASRLIEGLTLGELLLRRGRFPAREVLEIARQLLDALAMLHEHGIVHGQIAMNNIRLQASGQTVLLDAGIAPALEPALHINAFIRPDRYDGIAPELIGTGRAPSAQTDLYALGTLLWHLLAGRPPHPTGDPLAKLAAHQTQRIDDVRELAPETPELLARLIHRLTEPNPRLRPKTARELLVVTQPPEGKDSPKSAAKETICIGIPRRAGRSALAAFAATFQQPPSRRLPRPTSRFPQFMAAATAAVVLAAVTVISLHGQSRNWILAELPRLKFPLPTSVSEAVNNPETTPETDVPTVTQKEPEPLPKPDAHGVIELDSVGPYRADKLIWQGRCLTLKGTASEASRIIVDATPLLLRADEVVLDHIQIERASTADEGNSLTDASGSNELSQLLYVASQALTIQGCSFVSSLSPESAQTPSAQQDALYWVPRVITDLLPRRLHIRDSQIVGDFGTVSLLYGRSHQMVIDNVLKIGGGPLVLLKAHSDLRTQQNSLQELSLTHTTLRESGGLLTLPLESGRLPTAVHIQLENTALDLRPRHNGRGNEPLVTLLSNSAPLKNWDDRVRLTCVDSVTQQGLTPFVVSTPDGSRMQPLSINSKRLQGLTSVEFLFRGNDINSRQDSVISEFMAPRRSPQMPGIKVKVD